MIKLREILPPRVLNRKRLNVFLVAGSVFFSLLGFFQNRVSVSSFFYGDDWLKEGPSPAANDLRISSPAASDLRIASSADNDLRIAMCHKTLFGDIDLHRVAAWANYHHNLGFDRIFIWYIPEMSKRPEFLVVEALPYVTLLPNTVGKPRRYPDGYLRMDRDVPGNQLDCEKWCLQDVAKDYDWVLWADADEYLWFNGTMGVHDFAHQYGTLQKNTWLSFGKWMYTRKQAVANSLSLYYGLSMNPFTLKSYCKHSLDSEAKLRGNPYCPGQRGRSKVMVKPSVHREINTHGTLTPDPNKGIVHFHTDVAHMKEWPGLFKSFHPSIRPPEDFTAMWYEVNDIHRLHVGYQNVIWGFYRVYYDDELESWMKYVSARDKGEHEE